MSVGPDFVAVLKERVLSSVGEKDGVRGERLSVGSGVRVLEYDAV